MLMQGIATIESMGHVAVAKAVGVATTPPRVVAQAFHGVAVDGGRKAALVVFQREVHFDAIKYLIFKEFLYKSNHDLCKKKPKQECRHHPFHN